MLDEATLFKDDQGKPIEIVGYWTDITKEKEAEEKLRKSEEEYRSLFENVPIGLYLVHQIINLSNSQGQII